MNVLKRSNKGLDITKQKTFEKNILYTQCEENQFFNLDSFEGNSSTFSWLYA